MNLEPSLLDLIAAQAKDEGFPVGIVVASVGVIAAILGAAVGTGLGFSLDKREQLRTLRIERYEKYVEAYHRCALEHLHALNPIIQPSAMPPSDYLLQFSQPAFDLSTRVSLVAPREVAAANLDCDRALSDLMNRVIDKRNTSKMLTDKEHTALMERANQAGIDFETVSAVSLWGRKIGRTLPKG